MHAATGNQGQQDSRHAGTNQNAENPRDGVGDERQDDEPAVRCRHLNVRHVGEHGRDGRPNHEARNVEQRILGGEGNGALRDVGSAEHEVDVTRTALVTRERLAVEQYRDAGCQRWRDARGRDASHEQRVARREERRPRQVGGLVDGTAEVGGTHDANDDAQYHRVGVLHALQEGHERRIHVGHRRRDNPHDGSGNQHPQDGIEENGLEPPEFPLRQNGEQMLQAEHGETREVPANNAAEEPNPVILGHHADREPDHEAAASGDGLRDVGTEDGHHESHRNFADVIQHGRVRVVLTATGVHRVNAEQHRDGDEHPAGDHERQHVRHAVHEAGVGEAHRAHSDRTRRRRGAPASRQVDGRVRRQRLVDEVIRLLDASRHRHHDERLPRKTLGVDVNVGGNNDRPRPRNFFGGQWFVHAALPVRLDLHGEPAFPRGLNQGLLGHVGVRYPRGTPGCCNQIVLGHALTPPAFSARHCGAPSIVSGRLTSACTPAAPVYNRN